MLVDLRGHIKAITVGDLLVILEKLDRDVLVSPNPEGNLNLIKPTAPRCSWPRCSWLGYIDTLDGEIEWWSPAPDLHLDQINGPRYP